jgi:hypothetical protein
MVQEHLEQARQQFEHVARLEPRDQLAAQFARVMTSPPEAPDAPTTAPPRAADPAERHEPSPPSTALLGTWKATPTPDLSNGLTLERDRRFTWKDSYHGQADSIRGVADYLDGVLTLTPSQAPALVGRVVNPGEKPFGFELLGGPQAATIRFSR